MMVLRMALANYVMNWLRKAIELRFSIRKTQGYQQQEMPELNIFSLSRIVLTTSNILHFSMQMTVGQRTSSIMTV